ncbi:Protein-tyrosine phosphatase [Popillia japonica]|uniref:protein-tyrosine-phosphatase n=1 Tax=Popillia japonica TaxID=7064 RepID=A0AAW1MYM6_POPJA
MHYQIRVILLTNKNEGYYGNHTPVVGARTTCRADIRELMKVKAHNISMIITIQSNRSKEICPLTELHTTFSNLEPYHEYMLILYRNGSKIQEWTERTAEGVPEQVQNFQRGKASNTSIELIWDEPQKKNGNIRGYIIKYRHTKWKGCRTLDSKMNTTMLRVLETKVHLNSLLPYSSYVVNIWAFTVYDGLATETSIETSETKPGPVRNATIYSKTNTSVSIRWLPPYPPMGKLCLYEVKTNLNNSKKYEVSRTSDCELWPGHICTTISNLPSNVRVRIRIKAQNINVPGLGNETDVSAEVIEEVSEPPQYIRFEWDNEYGLTLFWPHPDITNGPLQQFLITINEKEYLYNVSKEEAQYTYKLNLPEELTSQTITVGVKAKNSAGISQLTNSSTYTPPKVPKFKKLPSIEMKTNTTITVNIPSVSNVEGDTSNMYIVITNLNRNEKIRRQYLNPLEQQLLQDVNISVTDSWVASAFNLNDSAKQNGFLFEVGSNTENPSSINKEWKLEHRKLNMENAYMITFVLNNTFKEFTRLGVYPLQSSAPPKENAYMITFVLNNTFKEFTRLGVYPLQSSAPPKPTDNNSLFYLLLLLIPIILCVLCVLVIRRNQDKVTSSIYVSFQKLGLSRPSTEVPLTPLPREDKISVPQSSVTKPAVPVINKKSDGSSTEIEKYSNLVKICDLNDYIRKCIENGEFEKQHGMFQRGQTKPWICGTKPQNKSKMFQRGQTKPWICGTKPQNKSKNRYINLSAYDHTRVKLEIINQDPYSDYINANYIDGYKSKNTYIATQGPKVSTLNDFWRMIWQEKVEFIIMIANIVEGGKKKVEKYWPEINESKEFINIKVEYLSVDVMANYEIRHFIVSREGETRKIQQFHFLTWPDHGVPLYPQSLSPFLKKILTIPQGGAPVVVHCSAGVGRTGSLILCDICLRMAAREGKIDAFYYLNKIREQRVNMVDNVEQYKLVHLVLLQCLVAPETGVLCNETMENNIETILAAKIDEEMQYLDESAWQDEAMRNTNFSSDLPIIHSKNRFKSIIPEPASRICLTAYPSSDPSSIYINAVSVDAFAMPAKFVVTQNPLTSTVGDFWRLVEQKEITMIVCLNQLDFQEKTTCKFYPTSSAHSMKVVQYLEIKYSGKEVNAHFKVYSVTMSNLQTQEDVQIKIIHLNNWHHSAIHPDNPVGLLTTYEEMNHLGRNSDTILVTCHDGAKACGLYVAMCFIVDKIKMEQICDVCLAVRTVRHSRKEFVRNAEQYAFLYKCALEYVRQFEMYSNFRASK